MADLNDRQVDSVMNLYKAANGEKKGTDLFNGVDGREVRVDQMLRA